MLNYVKAGDIIDPAGVKDLIEINRKQLKVWSIGNTDRRRLEAEIEELKDLLKNPKKYGVTLKKEKGASNERRNKASRSNEENIR